MARSCVEELDPFYKDPDSTKDFTVDWSDWLEERSNDTISASAWTVPAGLTLVTESNTTTAASVFVSGGSLGEEYRLVNRITTVGGRTEDQTVRVIIRDF